MRSLLHKAGYRYSLHKSELPGNPDIVLSKYRTVIFVNGCFWHNHKNCREGRIPSSNSIYWKEKLDKNVTRDLRHHEVLREKGWHVIVVWECEVEKKPIEIFNKVVRKLNESK